MIHRIANWKWNKPNLYNFTVPNFWGFCRENKLMLAVSFACVLVTYGIRMSFCSVPIDDDSMIATPSSLYDSWIVLGRFGLIATKWLLGLMNFNPMFALAITFLLIYIGDVLWCFLFTTLLGTDKSSKSSTAVFSLLFITHPVFALAMNFTLQSVELTLCFTLLAFSLLFVFKWALQHTWLDLIPAILLAEWCFSCYQAFVPLYIAGAVACFLLLYRRYAEPREVFPYKKSFFYSICIKLILVFIAAFVLYQVLNKVMLAGGELNSYISDQIHWGNEPFVDCVKNILRYIRDVLLGSGEIFNPLFGLVALLLLLAAIPPIVSHKKDWGLYAAASLGLLASPFLMPIVFGGAIVDRSQFTLPFVAAFGVYLLITLLPVKRFKLRALSVALCAGVAFIQVGSTDRLFYTEYLSFQQDKATCEQIAYEIGKLGQGRIPQQPVVVVGWSSNPLNNSSAPHETIGASFFQIESFNPGRVTLFMHSIGYPFARPTGEQYQQATELASDMPAWPSEGSVQLREGIIIVKMS